MRSRSVSLAPLAVAALAVGCSSGPPPSPALDLPAGHAYVRLVASARLDGELLPCR